MTDPQTKQNPEILPQTIPDEVPESDLGISKIREDIAALKKDAQALEAKRVDFEKNKNTLDKAASDQLKQEIDAEAKRIEAKKIELLTLLKQTKGELEALRGNVETTPERNQLDQLEKEIKEIQGEKKNMFEKGWERAKENPRKTAAIATGAGLLVRGIVSLFKRKKKSAEEGEGKKEKKKGRFRKRVLGIGAGIGAIFGINWLINKFKGDTLNPPEIQADDFDKLSEAEKIKYNTFGAKVNGMYANIYQKEIDDGLFNDSALGNGYNSTDEQAYAGIVPFTMDKTYSNIQSMISEGAVNRHVRKKNVTEYKELLLGFGKEKLQNLLGPFLMKVSSFNVLGRKPGEDISVKIQSRLDANPEEACKQLDFFFRQFIMVLTYLEEKKIQLRRKLVIQKINEVGYGAEKQKLVGLDDEAQNDLIEDALDDEDWMNTNVNGILKSVFENQKITSLEATLNTYQLYDETISEELHEAITGLDEERANLLDYDEDLKTDIIDRAQIDIADGSLEPDNQKKLGECADNILNDAIGENGEGFMQQYFEPFAIACNMDAAAREKFLQESGGKELLENFGLGLAKYKEKFASGTITKEDITNFKDIVNKYLAFKKETIVAVHTLQNIGEDNPEKISRCLDAYWASLVGLYEGCTQSMPILERVSKICTGLVVLGGTLYLVSFVKGGKTLRNISKVMIKVGAAPAYGVLKLSLRGVKRAGGKMLFSGRYWQREILDSSDPEKLLRYAIMNGELSNKRIAKICRQLNKTPAHKGKFKVNGNDVSEALVDQFIVERKRGFTTVEEVKTYRKYCKNKNLRNIMVSKERRQPPYKRDRIKDRLINRKLARNYIVETAKIKKVGELDAYVQLNKKSSKVLENMMQTISPKQFDAAHAMLTKNNGSVLGEIDAFLTKMGNRIDVNKFGKLLGKNIDQFADAADMKQFLTVLETSKIDAKYTAILVRRRKEVKTRLAKGEKLDAILKQLSKTFLKAAPEIKAIDTTAINKVAFFLYEKRKVNLDDLLKEFEPKGKYANYATEFKSRYAAAKNDAKALQDLDTEFASRLLRDGKKIEDILEYTADQKAVAVLVGKDTDELKKFINTDLRKQGNKPGSVLDIYYKKQLNQLEEFKYKIKGFTADEISTFTDLRKLEFKSHHIVELLELKKTNKAVEEVFEKTLNKTDDLKGLVAVLRKEKAAGTEISETLIKTVEKMHLNAAIKSLDDVAKVMGKIAKFFTYVAKVS